MREPDILPDILAKKWPNLKYVRQVSPIEYHSECPRCGMAGHVGHDWPDRFFMRIDGSPRGYCRRCGYQAFADANGTSVTLEMRQQWLAERIEREEKAKERVEETLALLEKEKTWMQYHYALNAEALLWWNSKGVVPDLLDFLKLGWCESRAFWSDGQAFYSPSATIPVFAPGWRIKSIRHRIIKPAREGDKYRPERAGLPMALYYANPAVSLQDCDQVILVEGEIKAIVVADKIGCYCDNKGKIGVVGVPGKQFRLDLLVDLLDCKRVFIVFDPDAQKQAWGAARYIGKAARVVYLPCKPDDLFVRYNGTREDFLNALRYGRQL